MRAVIGSGHQEVCLGEGSCHPCPLLDNPQALVDTSERSCAHSTDLQDSGNVRELAAKCEGPAAAWTPVADEMGACSYSCESCRGCAQEK